MTGAGTINQSENLFTHYLHFRQISYCYFWDSSSVAAQCFSMIASISCFVIFNNNFYKQHGENAIIFKVHVAYLVTRDSRVLTCSFESKISKHFSLKSSREDCRQKRKFQVRHSLVNCPNNNTTRFLRRDDKTSNIVILNLLTLLPRTNCVLKE